MGLNYYHDNQWELRGGKLGWDNGSRDDRWVPLHRLLNYVYHRYRRPLYIAETSHFGAGRGQWIRAVAEEVALARAHGTPIDGICIYPILDRPDWDDLARWHNSGLWDLQLNGAGTLQRLLNESYNRDLREAQAMIVG